MTHLGQHLLTRADLARLSVPAARILSWLANGWLDQIGSLPNGRAGGDPVFTVQTRELRHELAARLATIGKTSVVFTQLRVRSLLLRAMLTERMPSKTTDGDSGDEESQSLAPPIELANHLEFGDLGAVLQEAIEELQLEVDSVQRIAVEEAALEEAEASDLASSGEAVETPIDDDLAPEVEQTAATVPPSEETEEEEDLGFFDTEALADELASWGDEEEEEDPVAAPPQPHTDDTQPESETPSGPEAQAEDQEEAAAEESEEESFGPTAAELDALRDALAASLADYRNVDKPFGPDSSSLEMSAQDDFADSIERLSATLEEVQLLAQEAADLGEALSQESDDARRPSAETLAELGMLDDPMQLPPAGAEEDAGAPPPHQPEEADNTELSILDQLTVLDERDGDLEPESANDPEDTIVEPEQGSEEEAVHEEPTGDDIPVEEAMVELEELGPFDVLPDPEVESDAEPVAQADELDSDSETEPVEEEEEVETELEEETYAQADEITEDETDPEEEPSIGAALDAVFGGDTPKATQDVDQEPEAVEAIAEAAREQEPIAEVLDAEPVADEEGDEDQAMAEAAEEDPVAIPAVAAAAPAFAAADTEVHTFLTDLRETLVELVRQPPAPSPDLEPLVTTVREGFERSSRELSQTNVAIGSLVSCVGELGKRLSHRMPVGSAVAQMALPAPVGQAGARQSTWVLLAVCLLIMCWSAVLWWKTADMRLAIGTLLGANAVACCLLVGRRD